MKRAWRFFRNEFVMFQDSHLVVIGGLLLAHAVMLTGIFLSALLFNVRWYPTDQLVACLGVLGGLTVMAFPKWHLRKLKHLFSKRNDQDDRRGSV